VRDDPADVPDPACPRDRRLAPPERGDRGRGEGRRGDPPGASVGVALDDHQRRLDALPLLLALDLSRAKLDIPRVSAAERPAPRARPIAAVVSRVMLPYFACAAGGLWGGLLSLSALDLAAPRACLAAIEVQLCSCRSAGGLCNWPNDFDSLRARGSRVAPVYTVKPLVQEPRAGRSSQLRGVRARSALRLRGLSRPRPAARAPRGDKG